MCTQQTSVESSQVLCSQFFKEKVERVLYMHNQIGQWGLLSDPSRGVFGCKKKA